MTAYSFGRRPFRGERRGLTLYAWFGVIRALGSVVIHAFGVQQILRLLAVHGLIRI